jgi:hypothetical protein
MLRDWLPLLKSKKMPVSPKTLHSFQPVVEQLERRDVPSAAAVLGSTLANNFQSHTALVGSSAGIKSGMAVVYPPAAPSFTATAVSANQINLSWGSVSGANGYAVDEWINGAWRQIDNLGGYSTGVAVTGSAPSTTYYFDVAAYNSAGTTWASYRGVTTPAGATVTTVNHPAAAAAYVAVNGSLFGPNGPSYLDVRQGQVGDCWLLSSLAEVAARDPQDIRNMFAYDGTAVENGSVVGIYTVRLFDNSGVAHSIVVDTELPQGGGYYDHPDVVNGVTVLWVALAEKAYAEANGAGYVTTSNLRSDSYAALNNGDPAWALHAITGKPASDFSINPNNIAAAWNQGELVVLCTTNPVSSDIVGDHCYAVVGYNPRSSQPFEVYNPWGTNSQGWYPYLYNGHQVYGLFNATAGFLSQNFTWQSFGVGSQANDGWTDAIDLFFTHEQQGQHQMI